MKTRPGRAGDERIAQLTKPTHLAETGEPAGFRKVSKSGNYRRRRNGRLTSSSSWHDDTPKGRLRPDELVDPI